MLAFAVLFNVKQKIDDLGIPTRLLAAGYVDIPDSEQKLF